MDRVYAERPGFQQGNEGATLSLAGAILRRDLLVLFARQSIRRMSTTAVMLARKGIKVYAVDLSPEMCHLAREKAKGAHLPIRVMRADMRNFCLPNPVDLTP